MDIRDYLKEHRLIVDGSMGTYYSTLVNQMGVFSEYGNLSTPNIIEQIHREYMDAGARLIRTNTFAANRHVLQMEGKEVEALVRSACTIAKKAVKEFRLQNEEEVWIAGNIGPIVDKGDLDIEEIREEYCRLCDIFMEENIDAIHFETFSSLKEIELVLPYIKEKNPDIFVMVSFSINKNGYTSSGIRITRLLEQIASMDSVDACGMNCGIGSGHMVRILKNITLPQNKYIYIAPNAGYPEAMQNRMVFMDNENYFAQSMKQVAKYGIEILGGCCGTTPKYIKALANQVEFEPTHRMEVRAEENGCTDDISQEIGENRFYQLFSQRKKVIAVELDPPFDGNIEKIMECAHSLKVSGADIITIADSPMGRSRVDSILMSLMIMEETGMMVMPHLCCRDRNMISMRATLLGAYIHGIRNFLLVTGDPVPGESRQSTTGVFDSNSIRLMEYVKEMNVEHFVKEPLYYGGALNYARGSLEAVIKRMQQKMNAGAKYFLTQPIFSKEDADRIRQIKERVDTKILCGIMPLVSYRNANFIKNEITGINVPDEVVNRYRPDMGKEEAEMVGAQLAMEIMEMTAEFADGYYFMLPFNRVSIMEKINFN